MNNNTRVSKGINYNNKNANDSLLTAPNTFRLLSAIGFASSFVIRLCAMCISFDRSFSPVCSFSHSLWLSSGILWFPIVLIHIWLRSDRHSHAIFARALKPFDTIRVRCILWAFVHSLLLFWCMMLCMCVCALCFSSSNSIYPFGSFSVTPCNRSHSTSCVDIWFLIFIQSISLFFNFDSNWMIWLFFGSCVFNILSALCTETKLKRFAFSFDFCLSLLVVVCWSTNQAIHIYLICAFWSPVHWTSTCDVSQWMEKTERERERERE